MDIEKMLTEAAPARRAFIDEPDSPAAIRLYQQITALPTAPAPLPGRSARRGRRHRRRTLTAVGTGLLAASASAALVVGLVGNSRPVDTPGHTAAVQLLSKIAIVAAKAPVPKVTDNQFMYIETKVAGGSAYGKPITEPPFEQQTWTPVADLCRTAVNIVDGKRTTTSSRPNSDQLANGIVTHCPVAGKVNDPTYRLLQSLPTDPHALLNVIYQATAGAGQTPDQEAFTTIGDLLRNSIAPPDVSAALFRAAALIPGVTIVPQAKDAIGRPGVAVSFALNGDRSEWVFSQRTFQMLGEIDYVNGTLTGETAIIARAFTDRAGEVPSAG